MNPKKSESIRWIEKDKMVFVLDSDRGIYYKLNNTASVIWNYSDGTKSEKDLADIIKTEFKVKKIKHIEKDVKNILSDLVKKNILEL